MRIQVNLSEKMVGKIDSMAEEMGVSRSALCSTIIGTYVMNYEKSVDVLEKVGYQLVNSSEEK